MSETHPDIVRLREVRNDWIAGRINNGEYTTRVLMIVNRLDDLQVGEPYDQHQTQEPPRKPPSDSQNDEKSAF